jgi:menaquinone-dependent protoporphyrinogen IX oxidase
MNDHRVLVAYSSRHGGTAVISEWIAAELAEAGLPVDTRDLAAVDFRFHHLTAASSRMDPARWNGGPSAT